MEPDFQCALAVVNGVEPSFDGYPLQPGVHLRWSFSRYLPYPRAGFLIERRLPWLDEFRVGSWEPVATVRLPTADMPVLERRVRGVAEARSRVDQRLLGAFEGRYDELDFHGLVDLVLPKWPRTTAEIELDPSSTRGPRLAIGKLDAIQLTALDPRSAAALGLYYVDPLLSGVRADYRVTGLWDGQVYPWNTTLAKQARERGPGQWELAAVQLKSDRRMALDDTQRNLLIEGSAAIPLLVRLPLSVGRLWLRVGSSLAGGWSATCWDESGGRVPDPDVRVRPLGSTLRIEATSGRFQQVELVQTTSRPSVWTLNHLSFQVENAPIENRHCERSVGGPRLTPATALRVNARVSQNAAGARAIGPEPGPATAAVELRVAVAGERPTSITAVRERVGSRIPEDEPLTSTEVAPGPVPKIVTHARLDGTDAGITCNGAAAFRAETETADLRAVLDLAGGFAELRNAALTQLGGDLTVELWVRPWPLSGTILAYDGRRRFSLAVSPGSARVLVFLGGASFESRATLPEQEWTHLALLVRGRTARLYVDGHLDATASVSEPVGTASDHLVLGAQTSGERAGRFSGQLADLIVVGFALRTLRGLSRDLVGAWTLAGNTAGARPGSDLISQGSPRFVVGHPETASRRVLQLDGASWLSAPAVRGLAEVDSELTLEAWVRPDPGQSWPTIFGNDWRRSLWLGLTPGDYRLRFRINGGIYESRTGIAAAAWSHVAASTDGRSVRLWIGGRLDAVHPALVGPVLPNAHSAFSIGADAGDYPFRGAIADVRIWRKAPSAPRRVLPSHHPLVAEWALAGDTRETARGNESRVIGSASFERGHPLDPTRSVLVLDGSSFVEAARPSSLVEVATEITLDAWVRPAGHADFQTIVGHEWTRGFWFGLTADGHARLWINGQNYMSRRRLSNGVWSRVTASYDGGEVRLYLQDELPDSTFAAPLGVVSVDDGPLRIGADRGSSPAGFAYPFRGALADVRIFARALDPAACDRIAATPMPQVAVSDNEVPLGRFRWRATPVDGFGRLGAEARSETLSVENTDPPSPPSAVRTQFRSFTGIIGSVATPSEFAPNVTLVTDILLPGDARVRDRILGGIVSYDATIEGTIGGRRREESILIVSATATTDNRLVLDVELPPLARLHPEIGQAIRIDYDAQLEVRWAWTGSQRVNGPDVSTFRIYDRQGAVDVIEATVGEVITDATNPDLFSVRTELASVPRRIEPSEWSGRSCLIASHRYRIESVERRGTVIEFSLRYLARPVHAPESGSRLVFAIELASNERDDPARWEGRRTTVSAGDRVPLPEHFENLNLTTLSEEAYTVVSAELAEGTPRRERLMMAELPPGATAPQPDEPAGALLGFSMDELDWGWRVFRVIGARAESGRTRLYLLRPADRSPARDLVLRRAQHFRGAWLTETLDMTVDIPPDRGTQPCEVAVSALDGDPGDAPEARRNESALSSVARAIAVDRRRPQRPPAPHVSFDAADFFGDSRATVDWSHTPLVPHGRFEVHRAIDSDVFARDLEQRRWRRGSYSPELLPEPSAVFDDDPDFDAWLAARFPGWAARSLADLFVPKPAPDADATVWNAATEVWRAWANRFYPALFDRDVTALAELPGNEAAFACVTQAPVKGTRHVDLVRGLADNRFLYRLRTRSASFAASDLSPVSAALQTPRIRPPRTPVFTRIEAGDRSIRLDWALSREPNLASYRLYRASTAEELEDLRWSREGHDPRLIKEIDDPLIRVRGGEIALRGETEVASIVGVYRLDEFDVSRSPELQAAFNYTTESTTHAAGVIHGLRRMADGVPVAVVVSDTFGEFKTISRHGQAASEPLFTDTHVFGLEDYFYRIVSVDRFGNVSSPSITAHARALDLNLPDSLPVAASWHEGFAQVSWRADWETLLQRRIGADGAWTTLTTWLAPGEHEFSDRDATTDRDWNYRLWGRNAGGQTMKGSPVTLDPL